jgi:hypothetical protein
LVTITMQVVLKAAGPIPTHDAGVVAQHTPLQHSLQTVLHQRHAQYKTALLTEHNNPASTSQ